MSVPTFPPPTMTSAPCAGPVTTGPAARTEGAERADMAGRAGIDKNTIAVSAFPVQPIQPLRRQLLFIWRSTARFGDVFLFYAIDVELLRAGDDLVERLVEVERSRLRKARVVHARDHERFEIGAREPFRFQLLDRSAHRIVQLQDLLAAPLAFLHRLGDRFLEEGIDAAQDRLIGAAAQPRPLLVAHPERQKGRLLEFEA